MAKTGMSMTLPPRRTARDVRDAYKNEYARQKDKSRQRELKVSLAARDIGPTPDVSNLERRESCRESLARFCKTYNPEAFYLGWSKVQLAAIARIEEAVFHGALYAFAMPRGSGKSTLCRMAAMWAISYGHCRYVFLIGANAAKALDALSAIKMWMRFLPDYVDDFPEISHPVRSLNGIANRASGQLSNGEPTLIEWSNERVIMPTVLAPANLPARKSKDAKTSGSIIAASGLTGDGIRGSLHTLRTGEQLRPDLVIPDDPQTDESAASITQNATRESLISGAVLGMAGPDRQLSAVMPCTVIRKGDFVDRILDRTLHPIWRGERTRMIETMPDLEAWDEYFKIYRECAQREPPNIEDANAHYTENREAMDKGSTATWPERKLPTEVSAIQHGMNIYCRSPQAFWAEYQNEPMESDDEAVKLVSPQEIEEKTHGLDRGVVPMDCNTITAFIDVQGTLLWWTVCGWKDDFTGYVVDYGAFPDQGRAYFSMRDAKVTLQATFENTGLEGSIYAGLEALCKSLIDREWQREDGIGMKIDRAMIDSGWGKSTDTVYQFCRQSKWASTLRPSKGEAITAGKVPMMEYPRSRGRIGQNWYEPRGSQAKRGLRLVIYDTNYWKSFVFTRFATAIGDPGSLSMFLADRSGHRMFAEQMCAESPTRTTGRGRTLDEWKQRPDRPDNHFLDCLVGCAVAASAHGVRMVDHQRTNKPSGKQIKLSDLQKGRSHVA